jgi:hypothetical protein
MKWLRRLLTRRLQDAGGKMAMDGEVAAPAILFLGAVAAAMDGKGGGWRIWMTPTEIHFLPVEDKASFDLQELCRKVCRLASLRKNKLWCVRFKGLLVPHSIGKSTCPVLFTGNRKSTETQCLGGSPMQGVS